MLKITRVIAVAALCNLAVLNASAASSPASNEKGKAPARHKPAAAESGDGANVATLQSDLIKIKHGLPATKEQKYTLEHDLLAVSHGKAKPDAATIKKLSNDIATALADGDMAAKDDEQLTSDVVTVLNSAGHSADEVKDVLTDVKTLLIAHKVPSAEAAFVEEDLENIIATAQRLDWKNKPL